MAKGEIYDFDARLFFCTVVRHRDQDGKARLLCTNHIAFYRRHNTRENSIEMCEVLVNLNKTVAMTSA